MPVQPSPSRPLAIVIPCLRGLHDIPVGSVRRQSLAAHSGSGFASEPLSFV